MLNSIAPLTVILLVVGATAALSENSILWGVLPFLLALLNELMMMWARRPDGEVDDEE